VASRTAGNCGFFSAARETHDYAGRLSMNEHSTGPPRTGKTALISTAAVQLLHDHTGRGPTKARTIINDNLVTIVLADTLTRGERTLVDSGRRDRVLELRHDYQMIMRDALVELVEGELDRKVIAFMSQNHIDPDLAVEVFVLEPEAAE
jgi:uncharacterized protein YbcI